MSTRGLKAQRILQLVPGLLLAGCATTMQLAPDALANLPQASDYPDADFVVLLDELESRFEPGPGGIPQRVNRHRRRLKVLRPTTMEPFRVSYSRTFDRVESMRAWTFDAQGRGTEVPQNNRHDAPIFDGSVLFTDSRVSTLPVPPLAVGSIYEEESITRTLDARHFVASLYFGGRQPALRTRFVLSAPAGWKLRHEVRPNGGPAPAAVESVEDGRQVVTFELNALPGLQQPDRAPPLWLRLPLVVARLEEWTFDGKPERAFEDPAALSRWLRSRYDVQATLTPGLREEAAGVLKGVPDEPWAKARALYEYACQRIQYCAIEIGYGGWIPHAADDVRTSRYGDCKDKATHLHTLLQVAGISSAPTLIYAHDGTPRPFHLPSLGANFNHAILAVDLPGGVVYADPTHRAVPFGQLPPSDQEALVLELRENGAALKTTPASTAEANTEEQRYELAIDAQGVARGQVFVRSTGAKSLDVKNRLIFGTGKLGDWLNRRLWARNSLLTGAAAEKEAGFDDETLVRGEVELPQSLLRGSSGAALLRASDLFGKQHDYLWPTREQPLVSRVAETLIIEAALKFPPGTKVGALPAPASVETAAGRYSLAWETMEGGVRLKRTFVRLRRVVSPEDREEVNKLARAINLGDHRAVPLTFAQEVLP